MKSLSDLRHYILVSCSAVAVLTSSLALAKGELKQAIKKEATADRKSEAYPRFSGVTFEEHLVQDERGIRFSFDADLPWKKTEMHFENDHFVIELPQVEIPKAGSFITPEEGPFTKIGFFQPEAGRSFFKLFTDLPKEQVLEKSRIVVEKNFVELRYLSSLLAQAKPVEVSAETTVMAGIAVEQAAAKVQIAEQPLKTDALEKKQTVKKAAATKREKPQSFGISSGSSFDIKEKMVVLAGFFVVLFAGLALFHFARRRGLLVPKKLSKGMIEYIAQYEVGPKQKLALVEVAGEKILLGVTPGGISFLKSFDRDQINVPTSPPLTQASRKSIGASRSMIPEPAKASKKLVAKNQQKPSFQRYLQQRDLAHAGASSGGREKPSSSNQSLRGVEGHSESVTDVTRMIREKLRRISEDMS